MEINNSIFKSYDIRGVYPKDLNEELAYRLGQAFVEYTEAKKIVVGRDARMSSDSLFKALTDGILDQGADVLDLGLIPTECIYYASRDYDAGIMITASHNPKEYNGLKMIKGDEIIRGKDMIEPVLKEYNTRERGKMETMDVWPGFLEHVFKNIDEDKIKPLKVVVDAGNGMAGRAAPKILEKLPLDIIPLNFELNGAFPARSPNPLAEGAAEAVKTAVEKEKADCGFLFDGDADRIFLVDEKGNFTRGDVTLLLLAKYLLEKYPGKGVAYNIICSKAVPEFIKKWGGKPIKTPVGSVNVRQAMIDNDGILGGEVSGHFAFKDNFYSDSGLMALLILLIVLSGKKKASELISELSPYAKSPEINFKIEDKEGVLNKIKEKYSDGKQELMDGVTVEYENWWFNLRPSNTEPLLRLTVEAETESLLEEKIAQLEKDIRE